MVKSKLTPVLHVMAFGPQQAVCRESLPSLGKKVETLRGEGQRVMLDVDVTVIDLMTRDMMGPDPALVSLCLKVPWNEGVKRYRYKIWHAMAPVCRTVGGQVEKCLDLLNPQKTSFAPNDWHP